MIIAFVFIVVALFIAAAIFITVKVYTKKKALEKIINDGQPGTRVYKTPKKLEYSSSLERLMNEKYTEYILALNGFMKESARLEYLKIRADAEHKLALENEDVTKKEIEKSEARVKELRQNTDKIHWHNYFCGKTESAVALFEKFKAMCKALPVLNKVPEPMQSFAQNGKPWITLLGGVRVMLSEFFVATWNASENSIRIYKYDSLEVKCESVIKQLPFGVAPKKGEVVAKTHWKHERPDGTPDKRFPDNPTRVDIFATQLIVSIGGCKAKIDSLTKTDAEGIEKKINAYKRSVSTVAVRKYVDFIFSSDILLFKLENIEKKIEADKALSEKEKAEKKQIKAKAKPIKENSKPEEIEEVDIKDFLQNSETEMVIEQEKFSEEEVEMILEARREKEAQRIRQEEERKKLEAAAKIDAIDDAPISQIGGTRVITNNIFGFNYKVEREILGEVELFFVNSVGEIISTVFKTTLPALSDSFRPDFELLSEKAFDSSETYYLFVRRVGEEEPIGKLDYKINISFALDFDF